MLNLDLLLLRSDERFQHMCHRLARPMFGGTQALAFGSWDGGRDILAWDSPDQTSQIVFQCKFTKELRTAKKKVPGSLDRLDERPWGKPVRKWILCMPVDPTEPFLEFIDAELSRRGISWEVWGKTRLLELLEHRADVLHAFFYPVFSELREHFQTEELELKRFELTDCDWKQPDPAVLRFVPATGTAGGDLLFDVIVRNRGTLEVLVERIRAVVSDRYMKLRGLPRPGLLLPKITYKVSLHRGEAGSYLTRCEPPLVIAPNCHERFTVALTETGQSWLGAVQLTLEYGPEAEHQLALPCIRVAT